MKDWDSYFIGLAISAAKQNTSCIRRQFGCVLVRDDNSVVASGYNGAPSGIESCGDRGFCYRDTNNIPSGTQHDLCYAVHAEQNALVFAAKHGVSTWRTKCYVTAKPCGICARLLVQAGVKEIIYLEDYPVNDELYAEFTQNIIVRKFHNFRP